MNSPLVTVLMSVYNSSEFLREAIDSMLSQTYTEFEFLIINDSSTDKSREIILSYTDPRIRLIENEANIGLTKSLNKGIALAKGKYIARMDADDISFEKRLQKQVKFLEANLDIGVCGTWCMFTDGREPYCPPVENDEIKIQLFNNNSIAHPSAMIRKELFEKYKLGYNEKWHYAQDYELWVRCSWHFKLYNIPEVLLKYRIHAAQISIEKKLLQDEAANDTKLLQLDYLNLKAGEEEKVLHLCLLNGKITDEKQLNDVMQWAEKLKLSNTRMINYRVKKFNRFINQLKKSAVNSFLKSKGYNLKTLKDFFRLHLHNHAQYQISEMTKFILNCLLHRNPDV